MISEQKSHDLIDRAFLGELSGQDWTALSGHVLGCDDCRARYNKVLRVARALEGGPSAHSKAAPAELAQLEANIFARIGLEQSPSLGERLRSLLRSPSFGLVATAAALAIAFVLVEPKDDERELQARGGAGVERPASVRAFCVDEKGEPYALGDQDSACPHSGQLKLALGNPGAYRYAFVVGRQQDGSPCWYSPRPPATVSAPAPDPKQGEVPFGNAVRLEVNHEVGPLRVYALFSDTPIEAKEVEAALSQLGDKSPADVSELPLARKDVVQRSLLLQVGP